ncbi:MAG TPA: glycosyltransferase, partial [Elusimicrobiota bacterium]|nr:glycosyltransferase [Elusimicrobiota bacterium]
MEKRRHARRACSQEARLTVGSWPRRRVLPARAVDFSSAGARVSLEAGAELRPGERVRLDCALPDASAPPRARRLEATVTSSAGGAAGLRFARDIGEQVDAAATRTGRWAALAAAIVLALLLCAIKLGNMHRFWYASWINLYSLLACGFIVSRMVLSSFYEEPQDNNYRPLVSIIIAVKNEEACIVSTVEGCLASRYPADRLEVIVVDDGSDDGTWRELTGLRARRPNVKLQRFEKNRGKRHAMAAGIKLAAGDVLLFVDSDSVPDPESVYRIVQPLADPSVGAVSGHVVVVVEEHNVISKMESVRYYLGHRFIKGAESLFGAVTCCPGPFSAYRRDAVLEVMDGWLNQRFLGVPATFGDDRSLTLRILRRYRVLFHFGARCRTKVPDRWVPFFKQQLRWKKSWMRELPYTVRTMCAEHPVAAFSYAAGAIVTLL